MLTMALSELDALSSPRSSGGGWRRSSARSGKVAAIVLAAVMLASSMNSSTSWFASLRRVTGVGAGQAGLIATLQQPASMADRPSCHDRTQLQLTLWSPAVLHKCKQGGTSIEWQI